MAKPASTGWAPDEARIAREAEQRESARVVGVDLVQFLGLPDGDPGVRGSPAPAICAVARRHRPDIVITINFRDTWGGTALNQADHIATGRATLDAVRDAADRWIFPEQLTDGVEPWTGVRAVWAAGSPDSGHAVETTATFQPGAAPLVAHRAYIEGLGWAHFDPEEFLEGGARPTGTRLGVPMATTFEVFSTGWGD